MVHFGDGVQALTNELAPLLFETFGLPEECPRYDPGERVRNRHEVVARYAFADQQSIKQETNSGNNGRNHDNAGP